MDNFNLIFTKKLRYTPESVLHMVYIKLANDLTRSEHLAKISYSNIINFIGDKVKMFRPRKI